MKIVAQNWLTKKHKFTYVQNYLQFSHRWFFGTPTRALDEAYNAALKIKNIEDQHFNGQRIAPESTNYNGNVLAYFQDDLKKYLAIIKIKLAEFNISRALFSITNQITQSIKIDFSNNGNSLVGEESTDQTALVLEKLKLIDQVLTNYQSEKVITKTDTLVSISPPETISVSQIKEISIGSTPPVISNSSHYENLADQTGILPRSLLTTISRLKSDMNPKNEEQILKNVRSSQAKTTFSIRFILLLIIIPLLTQQLSAIFVFGPIVDYFKNKNEAQVFLNFQLQEEALHELQVFEEKIRFEHLIGLTPEISTEEMEVKVKEKATEIAEDYRDQSADAFKNIFSDLLSFVAFGIIIFTSKKEIAVLKSFMDEIVYGLSDSAKAFIIILFTDMFVGYHSPHGWEVILEGISRHLGLPENHAFNGLFIATFPVILDTVFKYWIFRYLNRISPSAVATYKNMNE